MIIGVDGGVLGVTDNRLKVGVYHFVYNLLKALSQADKENQYLLYSFYPIEKKVISQFGRNFQNVVLRPRKGWLTIRLSAQFAFRKHDLFLGLSQAIPAYHPMKSVIYIYDLAFEIYPEHYKDSYARLSRQTKFAAKYADRIVAVSTATKNDLVRLYKINPDKIEVIYHGVGIKSFTPGESWLASPLQPATPGVVLEKIPYFLFVGSYKPSKNIPNIIKAFSLFIKDKKKPYKLVLAGSNYWGDNDVAKLIVDLKLEGNVKILGFVSEENLLKLYRGATAFVSPSFYEGFGLPFLEAMASGVPVITSSCGSIPEVVENAAILVDPTDIIGLKNAMISVASDKKLRDKLIRAGLKQAKKFSWQKAAGELLELLH